MQGPYDVSPRVVEKALLSATQAVAGVLPAPPPFVLTSKFDASGIAYLLCFFIDDFARRDRIESAIRQQITEVLVARQTALDENVSSRRARAGAEVEAKTNALLGRIRQFFSL